MKFSRSFQIAISLTTVLFLFVLFLVSRDPTIKDEITISGSSLIFDIGMNTGQDTKLYLAHGYRVVAVEANPMLVQKATEIFKRDIMDNRLTIINKGVGKTSGESLVFWLHVYPEWSSFVKEIKCKHEADCRPIYVTVTTCTELFSAYSVPFYLKVDIEAFDIYCIQNLAALKIKPKYVSVEVMGNLELLDALSSAGYNFFKVVIQNPFESATGPFGEFALDCVSALRWRTADQIKSDWPFVQHKEYCPDEHYPECWWDFHAKLDVSGQW